MKKSTWGTEIDFFFVLKPEALRITSVSYNVLLLSMFGVLQSTEIKTLEYVFLVLKNSTLTSPRVCAVELPPTPTVLPPLLNLPLPPLPCS